MWNMHKTEGISKKAFLRMDLIFLGKQFIIHHTIDMAAMFETIRKNKDIFFS